MKRLSLVLVWLAVGGCDPDDPCPKGWNAVRGACVDPNARADAGTDASEDAGVCDPDDPYSGFGDPCEEQEDCTCAASDCNTNLGECSRTNCLDDPSICPPDWTCFDLRPFPEVPADVTSICWPPS